MGQFVENTGVSKAHHKYFVFIPFILLLQ